MEKKERFICWDYKVSTQLFGNCKKLRTFQINSIILGIEIIAAGLSHITIAGQIRLSLYSYCFSSSFDDLVESDGYKVHILWKILIDVNGDEVTSYNNAKRPDYVL